LPKRRVIERVPPWMTPVMSMMSSRERTVLMPFFSTGHAPLLSM
jgi:hypothetical protein|tara:strand:- start:281 stop:412 length:132 start_codon:yes stop_codon:yes gene_type:complete